MDSKALLAPLLGLGAVTASSRPGKAFDRLKQDPETVQTAKFKDGKAVPVQTQVRLDDSLERKS